MSDSISNLTRISCVHFLLCCYLECVVFTTYVNFQIIKGNFCDFLQFKQKSKMSYNTRRSGGFSSSPQQPSQQNLGSVGQRRPVVTNNFVPGGQLPAQQKPVQTQQHHQSQQQQQQQQYRPQQQQQQQSSINFRNQNQQSQPLQSQQSQGYSTQTQIKSDPGTPNKPAVPANPPKPVIPGVNPPPPSDVGNEPMETEEKKKPFWANKGNRISKKEKLRRRNLRLSKMLQPKNAVMILNELIKNAVYAVEEVPVKVDPNQYKAIVTFDGQSHAGLGRSKIQAKNNAAENALKYLVKNKQLDLKPEAGENGDEEAMEISEDGTVIMPWQHVASFALFKLFSSWGEDPALTTRQAQEIMGCPKALAAGAKTHENKPAKKMPDNPEKLNPLMLINQMLPNAEFEEIGKSGAPPNVTFSYRCIAEGQTFMGTGPNKKAAKKQAAFGACHKILGVNYATDVYVPIY